MTRILTWILTWISRLRTQVEQLQMKLERDLKDLQADRDRVTSGATSEGCLMEAFLTCCGYMVCDPLWHGYELCYVLHLMVKQSLKAAMKLLKCCIFTPPPPPLRDRVDASSAAGRRPREAPGGRRAEGCPAGRAGTGTRGRGSITCLPTWDFNSNST